VCKRLIPDHPWVQAELQDMEDKRDPKKGIIRREEMRKSNPKDIQNLLSLAKLYINDGQSDKAKTMYAEAHKLEPQDFRVIQAYTDFLRTKQPPENDAAVKLLQELVDSIDKNDPLQKATAQLLMATHLNSVRQQGGANIPTTQAVDEAFASAAQMCDKAAVRLDIGSYYLSNKRYAEAEKWYRDGLAQTEAEKDADMEKNARQRIIETLIQSQSINREEELKKEIDTFRTKYDDDPYAFLAEGQFHLNAGRLDEALAAINSFLERRPDNALGHVLRGDIYFMRSLWQPALDDYRTAKGLEPNGFNYHHRVRLALCLENLGQNDVAVAELNSILADDPKFMPALDELQRIYVKLSQWQQAEDMLSARRKAEPDNPEWDLRLMALYRSSRDADKSIKAGLNAAQKAKYAPGAVEALLQTYLFFERYDDLIRFTNERLPADKRGGTIVDLLTAAAYAGKGDRVNALQRYNQVLDAIASNMEGFINVGGDLKKRLGSQTAMEVFQQRLAAKPDERPSKFAVGALQKDAGERDAYLNALKSLLETVPQDDEPRTRAEKLYLLQCLAIEYYQRGNNEEARKAYEEMLTLNPGHLLALNNLAYLLMDRMNDPQSALPYARRAANMIPFDANILDTVGWNHVLLGNFDTCISALRRAIGQNDKAAAIHYHAAEAFYRRANASETPASGRELDLREAETECRRAYELIRETGADHEEVFDEVLALGEKLGLRVDAKVGPK